MNLMKKLAKKRKLQEAKSIANTMMSDAYDGYFKMIETVWMYGFRKITEMCGDPYGKERLIRTYWTCIDEFHKALNQYQYGDDDSHIFAMQQELKRIGVDIQELQDEAERRYPNGVKRDVKRWGEE